MSARGVFDLRIWAEADSEIEVWALVTELQRRAQLFAPEGVHVRYVQLRDPDKTRGFEGTMRRRRGRKAA